MGLQGRLNDVSSDSIPLMLLALIAACVIHLRSFLLGLLHGRPHRRLIDDGLACPSVGSGLSSLIILAEQLDINRLSSYKYRSCGGGEGSDCVVCLCRVKDGDHVRRLDCLHLFHKNCIDGWLDHLNFNCPLCRSPLIPEERLSATDRRVGGDLVAWFSPQ